MPKPPITIEDLKSIDVEKLQAEIAELEGKMHIATQKMQAEIDGRKQLLKVVDVLKNGKKPRAPRGSKKGSAATEESRPAAATSPAAPARGKPAAGSKTADKIAELLARRGRLTVDDVSKSLAMGREAVNHALNNDDRFDMDGAGLWYLA